MTQQNTVPFAAERFNPNPTMQNTAKTVRRLYSESKKPSTPENDGQE